MIGNMIRPSVPPLPKISAAIGAPAARLFFEPQNTAAISSSTSNFSLVATNEVIVRITASSAPVSSAVISSGAAPNRVQTPATGASQNELKTITTNTVRSKIGRATSRERVCEQL